MTRLDARAARPARPQPGSWLRRWISQLLAPSPALLRRVALAGLLASALIILTGAAVRLSQSGLGCPDWPACTASAPGPGDATGSSLLHEWIEFGNRLVTVAIFVIAVVVSVVTWRFTDASGRRRTDLIWLALAQPASIVLQAVLGGVVVLTKLDPVWVSVHFLASIALIAATVALYVRCQESSEPARWLVRRELRLLARAMVGVLALMIAAGTVVTGTGPLAGARDVARYQLPLTGVTQLHADIGWLLGGLMTGLALCLWLSPVPRQAARLGWLLLGLIAAQGAIGYAQYFSGLPAGLVWAHVCGAVLIWITALRLRFALRDRGDITAPAGLDNAAGRVPVS
ncbi:MAG TPA: COX15/CtaA family protein [Streptosporangiaceae bacterium]